MKRIKAACIHQVLHFLAKEDTDREFAEKLIESEVERYKKQLDKSGTEYKIVSEAKQEDGSVIIEIIKQYNSAPVGDFLK